MIRFIDLRGQIGLDDWESQFAYYDTVVDQFVGWEQCYVWESWGEFGEDWEIFGGWRGMILGRFENITPRWTIIPDVTSEG